MFKAASKDKPERNQGQYECDAPLSCIVGRGAFGKTHDGEGHEDVFEREDVRVKPSTSAGVIAVEIKRDVGQDLRENANAEKPQTRVAPRENESAKDEQEKRFGVSGIEEVLFEATKGRCGGRVGPVSVRQVALDKLAVFSDAPDVFPEAVTKAAGRTIRDGVIRGLRRSEELSRGRVLVSSEQDEARQDADGRSEKKRDARS